MPFETETDDERDAANARLNRLAGDGELRNRYVALLRVAWGVIEPTWQSEAIPRSLQAQTQWRERLDRGEDVVTDRYTDSSIAYQGAGRDLGPDEIHRLLDWAVGGLFPDLTIVLDVPAEVGRQRRGSVHDRLEREHDEFHDRVRRHFLDLAAAAPARYLVVDGTQPPARLHTEIVTRLHGIPALAGLREASG